MNIHHHPNEALLLDYATGALGEAWSLAVATHLALCPACRRSVALLESLGGDLLSRAEPAPDAVTDSSFDAVMARLDDAANEPETPASNPPRNMSGETPTLPEPLRRFAGGDTGDLKWQRLGLGAYQVLIPTGDGSVTARLLRIPAGRPVPMHSHRGMELTLVLAGAFSDATGHYGRGDIQEADEELEHQPHAAPGEDCICLAVTDAPLRFSSPVARMIQPLLGI